MAERLQSFQEVLSAAITDLIENGFDSAERVERWTRLLREAAERSLIRPESLEQQLRDGLAAVYRKMVDRDGILQFNPGVERFTLERIKPALRTELDRRIMASANLIKLNRAQAIDKTLQRFQGWATSIPAGGTDVAKRRETKENVRKSLAQLPFEERRVLIDQGHKLTSAINDIVATSGGAIAGEWRSHWRQPGYNYREDHKDRDRRYFLIRDSWAHAAGLVKPAKGVGFTDDVTKPGEEVFCFPGESRVPFADGVEKAYRRFYSGELTTLVMASGKTISATPNHPILTPKGWIAANRLQPGDDVIEIAEIFDPAKEDQDDAIPTFAEIFRAVSEGGIAQVGRGQLQQFHGDGAEGDVDIVDATRPLWFDLVTGGPKRGKHLGLTVSASATAAVRSLDLLIESGAASGARFVRGLRQLAAPGFAFAGHPQNVGFRTTAEFHAQMLRERAAGNLQALREAEQTFPGNIRSTRVVSIERRQWSGHVFNLQTESGWYVTEGIIVHNCRCYYRFVSALRDLPEDMLTAKGKAALASAQGREEVHSARTARADAIEDGTAFDALDQARKRDRLGFLRGLKRIRMVPDHDQWHAQYDDEADEIVLQEKFDALDFADQVQVLLHEAGHRGQARPLYDEFKRDHLNRLSSFVAIANQVHLKDLAEHGEVDGGVAAEVFAESYARAMLRLPLPDELAVFWARHAPPAPGAKLSQRAAEYGPSWPNKVTRCQRCVMFLKVTAGSTGNACRSVAGEISAHGHCRLFEIGQPESAAA